MSLMTPPTNYRVVAVAGGTGGLGHILSKELLVGGFEVILLTRATPSSVTADATVSHLEELKRLGAKARIVKYDDSENLKKALGGVNVVLSTLNGTALDNEQRNLIKAAKEAGVRRFIPSEFGVDTTDPNYPEPFVQLKRRVQEEVKQSGMEYTFVFTGCFMDFFFCPWFGFDLPNRITLVGEGNARASFTHRQDIGRFLVQMLLHPDLSRNKAVHIAGDKASMNDVVELLKRNKMFDPSKGTLERHARTEAKERIRKANYSNETFAEQLQVMLDEGRGELKGLQNADYPTVKPRTLNEYFSTLQK